MRSRASEDSVRNRAVPENVQAILATKGLSLYRVSQATASAYGRSSAYFVPHNLYYDLRGGVFRPSVYQIFALSRVTGYDFVDWLAVFGFDPEDVARLQVLLPTKRTIVLDTSHTDINQRILWFRNRLHGEKVPAIAPLSRLLEFTPPRGIRSLAQSREEFLYVKVGHEDAFAFPNLLPGSIVRVNRNVIPKLAPEEIAFPDRLFLVEHSKGFCCARIRVISKDVIALLGNELSYAQVELRCPLEVRIWGAIDLEFRPILKVEEPEVPKDLARRWRPQALTTSEDFGQLLKRTRKRLNLSIREAARLSVQAAELLNDRLYLISPSSLSEYESRDAPPRDFHKIVTLCSIYGLQLDKVLKRIGISITDGGREAMPDRFTSSNPGSSERRTEVNADTRGFFEGLLEMGQNEVPFFLRSTLRYFSGSPRTSLDDFFWVGGDNDPVHPYLRNALLIMVNRRRKTPIHHASKPMWRQPIYLVLKRDGQYFAACCSLENSRLVIHPYGSGFHRSAEYRYHQDAEVVGRIVAIARRLPD